MPKQYPKDQKDRAVRMLLDRLDEYPSMYAACNAIGPFHPAPFKTIEDIEFATMGWVDWLNNRRLHSTLDYMPLAEYETNYYATNLTSQPEMSTV